MAYIGKTYKHQKDEHFKEFLNTLGIPEDRIQAILKSRPNQKLEKNGDEYVFSITSIDGNSVQEIKFKDGVEFDENVTESLVAKTTFTVDGDTVMQVQKFPDGKILTVERQYSDKELVVVIKSSTWDGFAHRHYSLE